MGEITRAQAQHKHTNVHKLSTVLRHVAAAFNTTISTNIIIINTTNTNTNSHHKPNPALRLESKLPKLGPYPLCWVKTRC